MKTNQAGGNLDNVVFENRNKNYGAYALRRDHDKRVILAFFIASSVLFLSFYTPILVKKFWKGGIPPLSDTIQVDTNLYHFIPIDFNIEEHKIEKTKTDPPPKNNSNPPPIVDTDAEKKDSADTTPKDGPEITFTLPGNGSDSGSGEGALKYVLEVKKELKEPMRVTDKMPEFPGGEKALLNYFMKNVQYPEGAKEIHLQGTVHINFIIEEDGSVSAINIMRGIGMGCEEEVVRVARKMPKWKPGSNNGESVRVIFNLPVKFTLK